jgi:hypothetical protein
VSAFWHDGRIQRHTDITCNRVIPIITKDLQAITYGAVGFITKSSPRVKITEAIQQILNGNDFMRVIEPLRW